MIAALIAGGMDASEAATLLAMAAVEMTAREAHRTPGAIRQQRWRERHQTSQIVTRNAEDQALRSVTKRYEVTESNAASLSKEEKKEVRKRESRASQLPDDWKPDGKHWDEAVVILGSEERAKLELRKFKLHAADKGRLAKNWNAAWVKWALQAVEYGARNGNGISNHRANSAAGRATAREAEFVTAVAKGAMQFLQRDKPGGAERKASDGADVAGHAVTDEGTENAH